MGIKMIVTDLDGTFYHKDLTYDKERFNRLYGKMKENDIKFVVASGNQYYQLISFFDQKDEMTFVSENGGYIVKEGKELFSVKIKEDTFHKVLDVIEKYPEITVNIVCGKKSAYMHSSTTDETFNVFLKYFPVMIRVDDLHAVQDQIMKFALMTSDEKVDEIANELSKVVDESLSVVTSGHGCIDLIVSGVHKGHALDVLMDIWQIQPEEVMAFGDAKNDLEMLKKAKYGFVMANGTDFMKKEIGRVAPLTNEEDGELEIIEEYFRDPELFLKKYE